MKVHWVHSDVSMEWFAHMCYSDVPYGEDAIQLYRDRQGCLCLATRAENRALQVKRKKDIPLAGLCGTDLYSHVSIYNFSGKGIPQFVKDTGDTTAEVARKLLAIAKETGCAGVILECVDYKNYPPDVNDVLVELM